jgi:hypothetical protein
VPGGAATTRPGVEAARRGVAPRWLRAVVVLAVAALAYPELARYAAERRLTQVQVALEVVSRRPAGTQRTVALRRIAAEASALDTYPGDERPANAAGTATMLVGDPRRAADLFVAALAQGERPEILANLGLARAAAGEPESAAEAMLRAVWLSPQMLPALESRSGLLLRRRLRSLERRLAAGELTLADLPPAPGAAQSAASPSPPAAR